MSNAVLNQVYNYYLTTYAPGGSSQYDAHKRSELRGVYNSIIKMNKESPVYLLDNTRETKEFAVSVKEQARELKNTISSLGVADHAALLNKKTAYSSNEEIAVARYIGSQNTDGLFPAEIPPVSLKVHSLASAQVNLGTFLPDGKPSLAPGSYSFDVNVNDMNYEFQYNIKEDETNLDIQKRLERLINSSNIGLEASIIGDNNTRSALRITSASTGLSTGRNNSFYISDDNTSRENGTVSYFGLNYMAIEPRNAEFTLNGQSRSSSSNSFTVEKMFEITLTGISGEEDSPTVIGLKTDLDSLTDNVHTLVNGYNSFIQAANRYSDSLSRGRKLVGDMNGLSFMYRNDLDAMGVRTNKDGTLSVDDDLLKQSVSEDQSETSIQSVKDFAASLLRKTNQISLNPMQYVDRIMVSYKNPGKTFITPYVTSPYSGMLFNGYC